jgi:photosystem II stability/assembly factor-like uncharacterized protein
MRKASDLRLALATSALLVGCVAHVIAPPVAQPSSLPAGTGHIELRYNHGDQLVVQAAESRTHVPTTIGEGTAYRAFDGAGTLLLLSNDPEPGMWATSDKGAHWTLAPLAGDASEVVTVGRKLYARGLTTLWRSEDNGASWAPALTGRAEIETLAVSGDGQLLAGAGGRIYNSFNGRGLRPLAIQGEAGPRFRSVAAIRQNILASVRGPDKADFLMQVRELVGGHAGEATAALDSKTPVSFGGSAIYLSHDGGALWKKTSLGLDAWLVEDEGTIYAVAADPLLEAAALSRKWPGLAHSLDQQLHDQRVDADDIRTALPWPGRDALLKGWFPLVFRTTDAGENWERVTEVPYAVRVDVFRQQASYPPERFIPIQSQYSPQAPQRGPQLSQPGRRGREDITAPAPERITPRVTAETLLTFLDPIRLLAVQNHAPLLGFAGSGGDRWAFVPTQEQWLALSAAVVAGTSAEGEIWTGNLTPIRGAPVELLRSTDGGQTFGAVAGLPRGQPTSLAAGPDAAYLTLRGLGAFRVVP